MIITTTALIVAPLTAIASHSFDDVPISNTFHADIAWLADAGVTKGCNPPANTEFCPNDNVSRGQMSAFMRRFAQYIDAEDGTPALADHATTAGSADSATTADNATNATNADNADNADTVDGRSFGCFADQTEYAGECWETNARADEVPDVFDASENCGTDAGRLPYVLELRRFAQQTAITPANNEWTSTTYYDGGFRVFRLLGNGMVDSSTIAGLSPYRCVFSLFDTAATMASVTPAGTVGEDGS